MSVLFVSVMIVCFSALSGSAGPIEDLYRVDPLPVEMPDMQMNDTFISLRARAKAQQARERQSEHQLVVPGEGVSASPQLVNVGGLVVEPGAQLPLGLREIIILGNKTKQIIVDDNKK